MLVELWGVGFTLRRFSSGCFGFPLPLSFLEEISLPSFLLLELKLWEASISCLTVWVEVMKAENPYILRLMV
jgi:hypothetical protein